MHKTFTGSSRQLDDQIERWLQSLNEGAQAGDPTHVVGGAIVIARLHDHVVTLFVWTAIVR